MPEPRVTKLDPGTRVHVRNGQVVYEQVNDERPKATEEEIDTLTTEGTSPADPPKAPELLPLVPPKFAPEYSVVGEDSKSASTASVGPADPKSSSAFPQELYRNGADLGGHCWSQSQDTLIVHVALPPGTSVRGGKLAVDVKERSLSVKKEGKVLVGGELQFSVDDDEDDLMGCWEVKDLIGDPEKRRLLTVNLNKRVNNLNGLAGDLKRVWWTKLFTTDPTEIDTKSIPGRDTSNAAKWGEVMADAKAMFKENLKQRQPPLPVPGKGVGLS